MKQNALNPCAEMLHSAKPGGARERAGGDVGNPFRQPFLASSLLFHGALMLAAKNGLYLGELWLGSGRLREWIAVPLRERPTII